MNKSVYILLCLLCLVVVSCEQKEPISDYKIQHVDKSLSLKEIETSLEVLGLQIERFDYYLPVRSKLKVYAQKYVNGISQDIKGSSTKYLDKGIQRLMIFTKKEENSISFYLQAGGGRAGLGEFDLTGLGVSTYGYLNSKEIIKGSQVPLYVYASNEKGGTGFSPDDNIDDIVGKYDLVLVLFVTLE